MIGGIFLASWLFFSGCSSQTISMVVAPSVETLSADELRRIVTSEDGYVFVDVRTSEEIETEGTVRGFLHIPIGEFDERYAEIPRDKKVIVACSRGARAGRGAAILKKHGYQNVYSTGMAEYMSKGYELVYPKLPR